MHDGSEKIYETWVETNTLLPLNLEIITNHLGSNPAKTHGVYEMFMTRTPMKTNENMGRYIYLLRSPFVLHT
jgi:hypothetical protein